MEILIAIGIGVFGACMWALAMFFELKWEPKEPVAQPIPEPVPEPIPEPEKPDLVQLMAEGIRTFEGWYEGSKSMRNNNPGNIKGLDGEFLVFSTAEAGFEYLKDYIRRACTGKHKAYKPSYTLRQFFATYAPDGDRIIDNYTMHVAEGMGVSSKIKLSEIYSVDNTV